MRVAEMGNGKFEVQKSEHFRGNTYWTNRFVKKQFDSLSEAIAARDSELAQQELDRRARTVVKVHV